MSNGGEKEEKATSDPGDQERAELASADPRDEERVEHAPNPDKECSEKTNERAE